LRKQIFLSYVRPRGQKVSDRRSLLAQSEGNNLLLDIVFL
jgi:hypothetical protein